MSKISGKYDRKINKQIVDNLSFHYRITRYQQTSFLYFPFVLETLQQGFLYFFIKYFPPVGQGVAALLEGPSRTIVIDRAVDVVFTLIYTINIRGLPHGRKSPPRARRRNVGYRQKPQDVRISNTSVGVPLILI